MLKELSEEREASLKQLRQQCDSQMSALNERLAHQIVRHCPEQGLFKPSCTATGGLIELSHVFTSFLCLTRP